MYLCYFYYFLHLSRNVIRRGGFGKGGAGKRMEGVPAAAQIWDQVSSGWFPPMMIYEYCPLMKLPMLSEGLLIGPVSFRINDGIGLQSSSHDFCPLPANGVQINAVQMPDEFGIKL